MKKRVLILIGTRPEAIKMAPVVAALKADHTTFDVEVCATAQHRELLDQVLCTFGIVPKFDLNVMLADQDLTDVTTAILKGLKEVLAIWSPDLCLVQGDTTTTLAASLAAFYHKIPVGHVEAGLRTGNIYAPWPEELNRRLTSVIATWHFAPTELARENLKRNGIADEAIYVTGNTVIDALLIVVRRLEMDVELRSELERRFAFLDAARRLILVTGHRRENFGSAFAEICRALKQIAEDHADVEILYPAHPNPHVQEPVRRILEDVDRIHIIEPVDYVAFTYLLSRSYFVLTDSGGVQEEAPSIGKPVLVLRDLTERPEAIDAGIAKLVGTEAEKIVEVVADLLNDSGLYERMSREHNPYGDGFASQRIADVLSRVVR